MAKDIKPKQTVYTPPKGLSKDEWRDAMIETKKGYTWSMSSIEPKDDEAKGVDYEGFYFIVFQRAYENMSLPWR